MWFDEAVFYQIYPLGYVGAERDNDFGKIRHRFSYIEENISEIKNMGITAVLFNPLFMSEHHGYDTVDFYKVDNRLGTNEEFKMLVSDFHKNGIKVVLDGVFNHVGRCFFAFNDLIKNKQNSRYKDWFFVDFSSDTYYNDGFSYEGWEGHLELVKLNLSNPEVLSYIDGAVKKWIEEFDIDGLRLDVCYMLPEWFMEHLRSFTDSLKKEFFLVGEVIHCQNFAKNISPQRLNSITGYECFKGMISSFNSDNLFEIEYSMSRLFSDVEWALMKGKNLLNFLDNHDVTRLYSNLKNRENVFAIYSLLFSMPGIPCIYYGSEFFAEGRKENTDYDLRPFINDIDKSDLRLYNYIKKLAGIRNENKILSYGSYQKNIIQNKFMVFERKFEGQSIFFAVNIGDSTETVSVCKAVGTELVNNETVSLENLKINPHTALIIRKE